MGDPASASRKREQSKGCVVRQAAKPSEKRQSKVDVGSQSADTRGLLTELFGERIGWQRLKQRSGARVARGIEHVSKAWEMTMGSQVTPDGS